MKQPSIFFYFLLLQLTIYAQYGEGTLSSITDDAQSKLPYYFPSEITRGSNIIESNIKDWDNEYASTSLKCFNEPILYNTKQKVSVFRLLYLRSFHNPILIKVEKLDTAIILTTKILDRQPEWLVKIYPSRKFIPPKLVPQHEVSDSINKANDEHNKRIDKLIQADRNYKIDSVAYPSRFANISLDTSILVKEEIWDNLMLMLNECNYWDTPPTSSTQGLDGSDWILESCTSNQYWFVSRWNPKDCFRDCCEYLLSKSNIGNEKQY